MSNFKNKYLKYKSKYLQLKKQLGSGINAWYILENGKLRLNYIDKFGSNIEIIYTVGDEIGRGSFGVVNKLVKDDDGAEFIFKRGDTTFEEGHKSDFLLNIIDNDMLVLFQGNHPTEFLIAKYNGKDLKKEYDKKIEKIKNEFNSTITQILQLLSKINKGGLYHNDIKLKNITIKNKKVYLIDFGFLSRESDNATFYSNSIYSITPSKFLELKKKFKNTDIFGFFYVCIDLLCLYNKASYSYFEILLNIFSSPEIIKLFYLYYYILPEDYRTNIEINSKHIVMYYLNDKFPLFEDSRRIFGDFNLKHTNLFRYMAFIYNKLTDIPDVYRIDRNNFKNFLRVLSDCLLPDFDYDLFIPKFKAAVNLLFQNNLENGFAINSLAFSPHGTLLAIGLDNGTLKLWDVSYDSSPCELIKTTQPSEENYIIISLVFHPTHTFLAASYIKNDNTGFVKLSSYANDVELIIDCSLVYSVRFNLSGTLLATSCSDGTVKLWSISNYDTEPSAECVVVLEKHSNIASCVDFNLTGTLLASGYDDGIVKLWSVSSDDKLVNFVVNLEKYSEAEKLLEPVEHSNEYPDAVMSIAFCQTYHLFSTGYNDGNIKIWRILDGPVPSTELIQNLPKHMNPVRSVIFHHRLPYMATCYIDDNIVNIWKISHDDLLVNYLSSIELFDKRDYVNSIAFHPELPILVTGSSDKTAKLWYFLL